MSTKSLTLQVNPEFPGIYSQNEQFYKDGSMNNSQVPLAKAATCGKRYSALSFGIVFLLFVIFLVVIGYILFDKPREIIRSMGFKKCHKKCHKKGPCQESDCPMRDGSYPFRTILDLHKVASKYNYEIQIMRDGIMDDVDYLKDEIKATLQTSINGNLVAVTNTAIKSGDLLATIGALSNLATGLGKDAPPKTIYLIQQKIIAMVNAIRVLHILTASQLKNYQIRIMYTTIGKKINDIKELADAGKRKEFDKAVEDFENKSKSLVLLVGNLGDSESNPAIFVNVDKLIQLSKIQNISSDSIVDLLALFSGIEEDITPFFASFSDTHEYLEDLFSKMSDAFTEPFTDARVPGNVPTDRANQQIQNNDYISTVVELSLEPSILENHKAFAKERNTIDTGAGLYGIRDDPNDVVPWVGLFRPTYKKSDGTSAEQSSTPLRSVPSDDPEKQMQERIRLTF